MNTKRWTLLAMLAVLMMGVSFVFVRGTESHEDQMKHFIPNPALRTQTLPAEWRNRLFTHAALHSVTEEKKIVAYVRENPKGVRDPKRGFEFLFAEKDGAVYSYTYKMDKGEWLEVRIVYPQHGIYMVANVYYEQGFVASGRGNTALSRDPTISSSDQKEEQHEWQGRVNYALLALADRTGFDRPPGFPKEAE